MSHRTRGRVVAAFAAGVAALLGTLLAAGPALADNGASDVGVFLRSSNVGIPTSPPFSGSSPSVEWLLGATGTPHDVTITMDASGIAGFATFTGFNKTVCEGDICTADEGDIGKDSIFYSGISLTAKPGVPVGTTGTVKVSGTQSNGTVEVEGDATVRVTVGSSELTVNQLPPTATAKPGDNPRYPISIGNWGSLPADGIRLTLSSTVGLDVDKYSDCRYDNHATDPNHTHRTHVAVCSFDTVIPPGRQFSLATPLGVRVTHAALYDTFGYTATPLAGPGSDVARTAGPGPALTLVPDSTPAAKGDPGSTQSVTTDNTADFAATGDTVTGRPGRDVTVHTGVVNHGPATVEILDSDNQMTVLVTVPKGTTAVQVPKDCGAWSAKEGLMAWRLGAPRYMCDDRDTTPISAGRSIKDTIVLRIGAHAPALATGSVRATTVYDSARPFDKNAADDSAPITVHVIGGASGSGGLSTQSTGGSGGSGGGLADTGFGGGGLAGLAAALVLVGAAVFASARRRGSGTGTSV